jgi:hypothetical protein
MIKLLALLIIMLMAFQIIRPFGLPGLRRRGDFWKIAAAAMFAIGVIALVRP